MSPGVGVVKRPRASLGALRTGRGFARDQFVGHLAVHRLGRRAAPSAAHRGDQHVDRFTGHLRELGGGEAVIAAVVDQRVVAGALREVFPATRAQRCWVHKIANVLSALPKSAQPGARRALAEIRDAEDREHAVRAADAFAHDYGAKWPKAVAKIVDDLEVLLAFFDFPAEHWDHLRTSNPIESVFATVRHRTVRTRGSLSSTTAKLMVFKLVMAASKTWRRLQGQNQLPKVIEGVRFQDGIEVIEASSNRAA